MKPFAFAIQVASEDPKLLLDANEREEITKDLAPSANLLWLPAISAGRRESAGNSVSTDIVVFAFGVAIASLIKPFYDGIAKEAGKDFWEAVKKLVAKLWRKQSEQVYNGDLRLSIVLELGHDHAILRLYLPPISSVNPLTEEQANRGVQQVLESLATDWERIQRDINHFKIGTQPPTSLGGEKLVHVVQQGAKGWMIQAESSVENYARTIQFVGEVRHRF